VEMRNYFTAKCAETAELREAKKGHVDVGAGDRPHPGPLPLAGEGVAREVGWLCGWGRSAQGRAANWVNDVNVCRDAACCVYGAGWRVGLITGAPLADQVAHLGQGTAGLLLQAVEQGGNALRVFIQQEADRLGIQGDAEDDLVD
jgi:hypothetical protein